MTYLMGLPGTSFFASAMIWSARTSLDGAFHHYDVVLEVNHHGAVAAGDEPSAVAEIVVRYSLRAAAASAATAWCATRSTPTARSATGGDLGDRCRTAGSPFTRATPPAAATTACTTPAATRRRGQIDRSVDLHVGNIQLIENRLILMLDDMRGKLHAAEVLPVGILGVPDGIADGTRGKVDHGLNFLHIAHVIDVALHRRLFLTVIHIEGDHGVLLTLDRLRLDGGVALLQGDFQEAFGQEDVLHVVVEIHGRGHGDRIRGGGCGRWVGCARAAAALGIAFAPAHPAQSPAARVEVDGADDALVGEHSPVGVMGIAALANRRIETVAGNGQGLDVLGSHSLERLVDRSLHIRRRIRPKLRCYQRCHQRAAGGQYSNG